MRDSEILQDVSPALDGPVDGCFIDIFQLTAHRNAVGQSGYANSGRLDLPGQVERRCIAFDREVGGYQDFLDPALPETIHQLGNLEILGADAVQRGKCPMQDMVPAAK